MNITVKKSIDLFMSYSSRLTGLAYHVLLSTVSGFLGQVLVSIDLIFQRCTAITRDSVMTV